MKFAKIDNDSKAKAFLRLLDLTIGDAEGSVVPYDLSDALKQIGNESPPLKQDPAYRRLETAARR